jgi:hypothetical protein
MVPILSRPEVLAALWPVRVLMNGAEVVFPEIPAGMVKNDGIPEINASREQRKLVLIEIPCLLYDVRSEDPTAFPAHLTAFNPRFSH